MSDYIERLRGELLRVEATKQRRVPRLKPVLVTAAIAAVLVAVYVAVPRTPGPEVPATATTTYRVEGDTAGTARVLRERMAALGLAGTVDVAGDTLTIPTDARGLAVPGKLAVYDWERSLIGGDEPVGAHQAETRGGLAVRSEDGSGWLALRGEPALTSAAVASASASTDPMTDQPVVALQLTPAGQDAFRALTRTLAQRGGDRLDDFQHLGIVVDDRVYSVPYIDGRMAPDGLDGAEGMHISGDFTRAQARELAAVLDSGPLPGTIR